MTDDILRAHRYALASLPSPKLRTMPIKIATSTFPKPQITQVWHDEFEQISEKLLVGLDLGSEPAATAAYQVTYTRDGMKFTPVTAEEFYGTYGAKDPSNKSSNK